MKKNILIWAGYQKEAWDGSYLHSGNAAGTEKCIIQLAEGFSSLGHNIYVSSQPGKDAYINGVTYWSEGAMQNEAPHMSWDLIVGSSYIHFQKLIENFKYKKSALWLHNTTFFPWFEGNELSPEEIDRLSKNIDHVVCLTNSHKSRVLKEYINFKDKISIIGHGLDTRNIDPIKPTYSKTNDIDDEFSKVFMYSSHPDRGLDKLLTMWPEISKRIWDAELLIFYPKYGEDAFKKYEDQIKQHSNIIVKGSCDSNTLHSHMKRADYWIYPCTYNETFCCTALEAMACGAIPVTTTKASLREVLRNKGIIIYNIDTAKDVANYIVTLEKQPILKANLIQSNYSYIKGLTWEKKAQEWLRLL